MVEPAFGSLRQQIAALHSLTLVSAYSLRLLAFFLTAHASSRPVPCCVLVGVYLDGSACHAPACPMPFFNTTRALQNNLFTGSYFAFGPSSVLGPRAADDALLLRLQRTGVRSSRRGQVGGLDQQER